MERWTKNETYRRKARKTGYRSRAAFKLVEIDERFDVLKQAIRVVDLCSAPGSWLQVVKERCIGSNVVIIGIDMVHIKPIPGVHIIQSSIESPDLVTQILSKLEQPAQVLLSDCSPKLTGTKSLDRARQLWLAKLSYEYATKILEKRGHFITKVFQSIEFDDFITSVGNSFRSVKTYKPQSSFKRSPEMYLIAKGFRGNPLPVNQGAP
ncbi:MAG: RlmE family RNA methyltransferase [Promethearchaeota archaeon]